MRLLDYLFAPIALAGLVATGWWGLYQSPQRPANLAAQLEQKANAVLVANGYDWARVRMNGQRAVLTGPAPSEDAVMGAAKAVLHSAWSGGVVIGGVTVVEVAVEPGTPVSPFEWRAAKTPDGAWILSGHVPSRRIAEQIEAETARLSGGTSPKSSMKVAPGAPGGNWQGVARFGLEILARAESGEVRLIDKMLRVSAVETDPEERASLSAQVANIAAPYRGQPLIRGRAAWTATHTPRGLVLSGRVGSDAERRDLVSIAQANYAGEVIDRMELAADMPDGWIGQVRAALRSFARFRSGEMGLYPLPGDVGVAIEGQASVSTLHDLRQDVRMANGPYAVTIWVDPAYVDVAEISGIDFEADPAAACEQGFAAVLDANSVTFDPGDPGAVTVSRDSGATLDKLVAVSHRCAVELDIEIVGEHADAIRQYMIDTGFDADRLSALGYGPDQPAQSNDIEDGRAANRRIEFRVRTRSN